MNYSSKWFSDSISNVILLHTQYTDYPLTRKFPLNTLKIKFRILITIAILLTLMFLIGQTMAFINYDFTVSLGLQVVASSPPAGDPRTIVEMDARLLGMGEAFWRISGSSLFDKMRRAWPFDSHFESIEETLESLWEQVPELESWETILLNPWGDPPIDHN